MRKILLMALAITSLANAQVSKVNELVIDNTAQNTSTTKMLVIDPITEKVGWDTKPTSYTPVPVSETVSGIVNNTSLQELGGVDKKINGVRIGKGNNNSPYSTLLGDFALIANTSGSYNTVVGAYASQMNTSGSFNTSVGAGSLNSNTQGSQNTAIGQSSMNMNTTGSHNTALGLSALENNQTGNLNTALGEGAGLYHGPTGTNSNTTGSNNTFVGANTRASANGVTNETAVGYLALGSGSNTVTLGNPLVTNVYTYGKVNAPSYKLSALNTAPSSASDTGITGEIRYTSTHIYVCIATNTWVRAALVTW